MSSPQRAARRWWIGGVAMMVLVVVAAAMVVQAMSWRQAYAGESRLLPGTTISGVDIGGGPLRDARQVAQSAGEAALDRSVTFALGDVEREVSARDLGATTDADEVAASAQEATASASWWEVVRMYWFGREAFDDRVRVQVLDEKIAALVEDVAQDIDRDPQNATADWAGAELLVREHESGRRVHRAAAARDIRVALEGGERRVAIPAKQVAPDVTRDMVERVLPAVRSAIDTALDRTVTVRHEQMEWRVSPREIGAIPDPGPLVDAALAEAAGRAEQTADPSSSAAADVGTGTDVAFIVPEERMDGFLDGIAAEVDVAPRDAALDYTTGWIEIKPEHAGEAVDRDATAERLLAAFAGSGDTVEVPMQKVAPRVTTEDFHGVLLLRLDERRLYLYTDGEISGEWPVAVGQPGSPTPTGEFEIGDKRNGPTWYNPAPQGWGAGMPAVIGPGPTNPLGLRALNWDRDGHDTLIRFHGTADTGSIGTAASRGCVRLHNDVVVELYELVESGTPIVSLNG